MSAYEDAVQSAMMAIYGVDTSSARSIATRAIAGFLAALPPSIVVDGRVVGLDDENLLAEIRNEFGDHGVAAVKWLTQAVLEVAE